MRTRARNEIPRDFDPRLVKILRDVDGYLDQVEKGIAAIGRGAAPTGGGGGGSTVGSVASSDHHKLSNLTNYDDHTQYLLLAGRKGGQQAYGTNASITPPSATWSVAGSFTSENSKTPTAVWASINLDNGAAIGDIIVLNLTTLPFAPSLDGASSNHSTITDSKGNTWTKRAERSYSDISSNGCCASIWTCQVTVAMVAGVDTLTVTYTGSIGAMAISSHRFLNSSSGSLRVAGTTGLGEQNVAADPSALSLSALPENTSYLFVRISGRGQAGSTAIGAFSVTDPTHTAFTHTGSITSGGTGNVGSCGQYRIAQSTSSTSDCQYSGGSVGYFSSTYIALSKPPGAVGSLLLGSQAEAVLASKLHLSNSLGRFYGEFLYFRNAGGDTDLSYIRGSDGAFVGPVVATGTDTHPDNIFQIVGSSDVSKIAMFEVDGLTTATTRTLTVPDVSATLILSQGTSAGQVIGTNTFTGGSASSLVVQGKVMLGENLAGTNFTVNRVFFVNCSPSALNTGTNTFAQLSIAMQGITTVNSTANIRGFQVDMAGTINASSGTIGTATGFFFTGAIQVPSGVTVTNLWAAQITSNASSSAGGAVANSGGMQVVALGDSTVGSGTAFHGLDVQMTTRNQAYANAYGIRLHKGTGSNTGIATDARGIDIGSDFMTAATTWYGIKIASVSGPTNIYGIYNEAGKNAHSGLSYFGVAGTPTAYVHLGGGSTTNAALLMTSGAQLTTATSGAFEFVTDDLYFTISTGSARKGFIFNDGTNLTAGRVPFATTNGRLTDDADFTFATDTLTITKIAATTLTGLLTFADAINIAVGTSTGTKIGTGTTQKLGFWNAAPVVQPTTGITAATFVANTSGIVDDSATFDGYTIGQVVAALRQIGVLA